MPPLLGLSGVGDPAPVIDDRVSLRIRLAPSPSLRTRHNFLGTLRDAEVTLHLIWFYFIYNQFVRPFLTAFVEEDRLIDGPVFLFHLDVIGQ